MEFMSESDTWVMEKRETLNLDSRGAGFSSGELMGEFGGVVISSEPASDVEGLGIDGKPPCHSNAPPALGERLIKCQRNKGNTCLTI